MALDWTTELVDQIDWHWRGQLRQRIDTLTDDEDFWEPVADSWNVRPRGSSGAPTQIGSGGLHHRLRVPGPSQRP